MRLMRNVRTGKTAVYDADLIESGKWEEVDKAAPNPSAKGSPDDEVSVKDEVKVTLIKGTKKAKADKPKAASDEGQ